MSSRPRRASAVTRSAACAALVLLAAFAATARAQETISDKLRIRGDVASTWVEGSQKVLLVERNVSINTDDATLTAERAVIWLTPTGDSGHYSVEVALAGHAKVVRGDLIREGGELFVTATVRPDVQLDLIDLANQNRSTDVHYLAAAQLRRQAARGDVQRPMTPALPVEMNPQPTTEPTTGPTTGPTTRRARQLPSQPITFHSKEAKMGKTPEGKLALTLSGEVLIVQTRANGDRVELQAERAVLFTNFEDANAMFSGDRFRTLETSRDLDAAYLEGDVRMEVIPGDRLRAQQSLRASRIVYEFGTDRAVITDALLHSTDPGQTVPIVVRARAMRKLGTDVYEADHPTVTTSDFATPSLSLSATKVTVRQNVKRGGSTFLAENVTPRLYGVPFFYFPRLWGSSTDGVAGLRNIGFSDSNRFGYGIATQWGLFETFGIEKPENIDASYRLDYYSERGAAVGLDAGYSGGGINENTLEPWGFQGGFTSYLVHDDGADRFGKRRRLVPHEDEYRGRIQWNHQQFLTDGWQVQARAGYVSDPTFIEQWFRNEFRNGLPSETSLYVKRTQDTEVFTALVTLDVNNFPTIADEMQEVTIDELGARRPLVVERLPEVSYHRLGDSWFEDRATLVSNNSLSALRFSESHATYNDFGIRTRDDKSIDETFTGVPSYGYTGATNDIIVRGDTRQELAFPMGDDRVRITPYGVVRYTAYSDSPGGSEEDRILGGVGVRTSTQFSKVYDNAESKLFDVHRMRHIIEPQVNLFASAADTDREDLYQFDEGVDGVSDIAAAQFLVRQRFQTKRGGEGRWRSVDFLTFNVGVTFYANEPDEITPVGGGGSSENTFDDAGGFRGVYLNSLPEASIPRSTAFADAMWRVTDTTAILGDLAVNVEDQSLATTALGLAAQRDPRVRYFFGIRYIGEINSTIGTVAFDYDISTRYAVALHQSFDLSAGQNLNTSMEVTRKFEQFVLGVSVYFEEIEDEGGIQFTFSPRNLPFGGPSVNGPGSRR